MSRRQHAVVDSPAAEWCLLTNAVVSLHSVGRFTTVFELASTRC